jgi:hypothetical protein
MLVALPNCAQIAYFKKQANLFKSHVVKGFIFALHESEIFNQSIHIIKSPRPTALLTACADVTESNL